MFVGGESTSKYLKAKNKKIGTPFLLRPFTTCTMAENLSITGSLARRPGSVQIEYQVEGALDRIRWPGPSNTTGRCHGLWRHTCFELFFSIKNKDAYWEVNLCQNDCWNVYHFTQYRTGMREEKSIGQPLFRFVTGGDFLSLTCTLELNGLIDDSSDLEVGVSSVIQATDGGTSYWAIDHQGLVPDFHYRPSFCLGLPAMMEPKTDIRR